MPPTDHLLVTPAHAARDVTARVAETLSTPKAADPDSFVLHAPLEFLARVGLLGHLPAERIGDGVDAIERLERQYLEAGDPVASPEAVPVPDPVAASGALLAAVTAGDVDGTDALAASLLPTLRPHDAVGLLGGGIVASLAAAGHAPIGLALLMRVPNQPATLLRPALRVIAGRPDWRVSWFDGVEGEGRPGALHDAVRRVPHLGRPGSDFIYPLMSQVQSAGIAAELLAPVIGDRVDVPATTRVLTRVAAWSMLHDDPEQAPYGWTHALTMPQGVMALAGAGVPARTALAVASTFTVGFRAAHGTVPLPAVIGDEPLPDVSEAELALAATRHHDAHVVKFTLACFHAARHDPSHRGLYLAAAAYLHDWWSQHG